MKLEEKRSDVNIATSMLMDAFNQRAESFVLVSGDTDFIGPVTIVRVVSSIAPMRGGKRVSWPQRIC